MKATVSCNKVSGELSAIASKSYAHRLLIAAAFSGEKSRIHCNTLSKDIIATVDCLSAMGAEINYDNDFFNVIPIKQGNQTSSLHCNESGTTLRMLLPIASAVGGSWDFHMRGRLSSRPLSPLKEELELCLLHWGTHPSLGELSRMLDLVLTPWRTQWAKQE